MHKITFIIASLAIFALLAANALSQTLPSYVPTNGLVGWWPMDGTALDVSGNGNHGTVYGPVPALNRLAMPNTAYAFDGINDKIVIQNVLLPNVFSSHTTAVWLKTTSSAIQIFCTDRGAGSYWYKNTSGINVAFPGSFNHGTHNNFCTNGMTDTISTWNGIWHHLVSVFDHLNNSVSLFVDGQIIGSQSGLSPNCYGTVPQPTTFGCLTGAGVAEMHFFNGSLDDFGIWNRPLTQCEILDLYRGQVGTSSTTNQTACDNFSWNGGTYALSGQYVYTTTNTSGCDSTAILNLTINSSSGSSSNQTACDSFSWNGSTYTQSGQYIFQSVNTMGCDSSAILNLTINNSSSSNTSLAVCDSVNWNGMSLIQSGQFAFNTTNSNGCDSVAHLDLTVAQSFRDTIYQEACNSFCWNGATYTQAGQYAYSGMTQAGCDSNLVLILTIDSLSIDSQPQNSITIVGNTAQFDITVSASNPIYQWQIDNGFGFSNLTNAGQFSGANSSTLLVSNVQLIQNNNQFRCIARSSNICGDTSTVATLNVIANVGIDDDFLSNRLSVYPNPAMEVLHIEADVQLVGGNYCIKDLMGQIVLAGPIEHESFTLDIGALPSGAYFINAGGLAPVTKVVVF